MRWALTVALVGGACLAVPAQEGSSEDPLAARGPMPPPGYMDACRALIEQKQYDEARKMLQPVVDDHPGWARAHFFLAVTYHKQNRYEQASELFRRALELDPQSHAPRVFYGWSLYYLGRLDESREAFETYLKVSPGYPDAIFALGLIDFDGDEIDAAEARFAETIRLAGERKDVSTEAKARARLADVHLRKGNLAGARQELELSVKLNSRNYEPYFKLSRVLQRLGDAQGAEAALKKHDELRELRRPTMKPLPGNEP